MKEFPFTFKCSQCDKEHAGSPSFSFSAPQNYSNLSDEEKKESILQEDFCAIKPNDDFFIRTILEIPIIGIEEPFTWGVWVSQSKENFQFYAEHFNDDLTGRETFGWFSSLLPEYESTLGLQCTVIFKGKDDRPHIQLAESGHQLSKDFHQGISVERTTRIAMAIIHK